MPNDKLDFIEDNRSDCYSIMLSYSIKNYLDLVESAYKNNGGLKKQRTALKTNTAKRIRERMVSDLQFGAIFPPVVLGITLSPEKGMKFNEMNHSEFKNYISKLSSSIVIIDGMQRTTAMYEVEQILSKKDEQHKV